MKEYVKTLHHDVDYCNCADWDYRKRTRVWTNLQGVIPNMCQKDCNSMEDIIRHKLNIGHHDVVQDGDKVVSLSAKELRIKYKDVAIIQKKKVSLT